MGSLSEILQRLEECRQKRAAWAYVAEHMFQFGGDDAIDVTEAIVAEGCISKTVPKEVVRELIESIRAEKIIPLEEEIAELENTKTAETKHEAAKPKAEKQHPGKKVEKGVRLVTPSAKTGDGRSGPTS